MRKPSKPWYRKYNDTWYVCLNGAQVPLAKGKANKREAERSFHRLMAGETPQAIKPEDHRVISILDLFLEHSQMRTSKAFGQQRHNNPVSLAFSVLLGPWC
jgi:hypothetical protein